MCLDDTYSSLNYHKDPFILGKAFLNTDARTTSTVNYLNKRMWRMWSTQCCFIFFTAKARLSITHLPLYLSAVLSCPVFVPGVIILIGVYWTAAGSYCGSVFPVHITCISRFAHSFGWKKYCLSVDWLLKFRKNMYFYI